MTEPKGKFDALVKDLPNYLEMIILVPGCFFPSVLQVQLQLRYCTPHHWYLFTEQRSGIQWKRAGCCCGEMFPLLCGMVVAEQSCACQGLFGIPGVT